MKPSKPSKGFQQRAIDSLSKRAKNRAGEDVSIVLISLLVLVVFFVDRINHYIWESSQLYKALPIALGQLTWSDALDIFVTSAASIITFVATTSIAYAFGILAAFFVRSHAHILAVLGLFMVQIYRFFYIVPLVLSVTLIMVMLFDLMASGTIGPFWFVFGILLASSLCIAGYPVFSTVYGSIVNPDRRHDLLVDAIYIPRRRLFGIISVPRQIIVSKRLNDGTIRSLSEGIERAWHLTIVAVVIVETIVPAIYQHITEAFGLPTNIEVKGVGRSVLEAQSALSIYKVFGLMWALFIVDLIGVKIINSVLNRWYLRHYGRDDDEPTTILRRTRRFFRARLQRWHRPTSGTNDTVELAS